MTDVKTESRNRALIVEDEFLIALDLEAAMTGLGFEICGLAHKRRRGPLARHEPSAGCRFG
jgi:hypothetical protein